MGYQASGTLGRQIVDGAREVRILGETQPVRAKIEKIEGFSAHVDREEMLRWLSGFKDNPKNLFLTHGEPAVISKLQQYLYEREFDKITVPAYRDTVNLS